MVKAKIYTDPLIRKDYEGDALVLKVQRTEPGFNNLIKRCNVSFDGETEVVSRLVHIDDFYLGGVDDA